MLRKKIEVPNRKINPIKPSPTLVINDTCKRLKSEGRDVYNLGLGQSPFPIPKQVVNALKNNAHEHSYLPTKGLPSLITEVKNYYQREFDINVDEDQIMIGPGSKELLFLFQLVEDWTVLLPTPCWVTYGPQARIFNNVIRKIHAKSSEGWKLNPYDLEQACIETNDSCRPRMLLLNSSNNPTGQVYSKDELKQIANVARKYDLVILSDEIYSKLTYGQDYYSIYSFYPEKTVISSGLSKWCAAGGWRLGTFVFPKQLKHIQYSMLAIASESFSSVCSPVQYAAVEAFKSNFKDYLMKVNKVLDMLSSHCATKLQEVNVITSKPQSGFYLFADFSNYRSKFFKRGIYTSDELCKTLLEETGVAIIPGSACERNSSELSARIAFVNFNGEPILDFHDPDIFIDCKDTVKAIELLVNWLKG